MVRFEDLKVGTVVRLASGSPKMTVNELLDDDMVDCVWWSERLGILYEPFDVEVLVYPRNLERDPQDEASA